MSIRSRLVTNQSVADNLHQAAQHLASAEQSLLLLNPLWPQEDPRQHEIRLTPLNSIRSALKLIHAAYQFDSEIREQGASHR